MPWCGDTRRTLGEREGPATMTWWPRSPWWPLKLWPPAAWASGDEAVAIVKTLTTTTRNFFIFQPPISRVAGWKMTRLNHTLERSERIRQVHFTLRLAPSIVFPELRGPRLFLGSLVACGSRLSAAPAVVARRPAMLLTVLADSGTIRISSFNRGTCAARVAHIWTSLERRQSAVHHQIRPLGSPTSSPASGQCWVS